MSNVIPIRGPAPPSTRGTEYAALCEACRVMMRAFCDWLQTNPSPDDALEEIEATWNVLRQIHGLGLRK